MTTSKVRVNADNTGIIFTTNDGQEVNIEIPNFSDLGIDPTDTGILGTYHEYETTDDIPDSQHVTDPSIIEQNFYEEPFPTGGLIDTKCPVSHGDDSTVPILGTVTHYLVDGKTIVVNVTKEGEHDLHPGIVVRELYEEPDGSYSITSSGIGNGPNAAVNIALADWVWQGNASRIGRESIYEDTQANSPNPPPSVPCEDEPPPPERQPTDLPDNIGDLLDDYGDAENLTSPLVFDLDGNGIDLSAFNSDGSVYWDIDEDGFGEASGWIAGNDGLLAIDLNNDGIINDHGELFGTDTTDGFTVLSNYDSNSDDVIDLNDTQFDDLLVWVDTNSDGYSSEDELQSLTDLGITSINLSATNVDYDIEGNHISHESTFTINGQTQTIVDAWFAYDNTNSLFKGDYTLDSDVLYMPTLRGYGDVADLHIAMSMDTTLLSMVQEITEADSNTLFDPTFDLEGKMIDIAYRWAGVDGVDPSSRGIFIDDARTLEFLEKFFGDEYYQVYQFSEDPQPAAVTIIEDIFARVISGMTLSIMVQTDKASFLDDGASYNYISGELENVTGIYDWRLFGDDVTNEDNVYRLGENSGTVNIDEFNNSDFDQLWVSGDADDVRTWIDGLGYLHFQMGETSSNKAIISAQASAAGSDVHNRLEEIRFEDGTVWDLTQNLILTDLDTGNSLNGSSGRDILTGRGGDDHLYGKEGDDTYVWAVGDGNDIIDEGGGADQLILHGVVEDDIRFETYNNSNDLKINIGNEAVVVTYQFYAMNTNSSYYELYQVENLLLDDGTTIDLLNNLTFKGTDVAETINGTNANDLLIGGLGNDTLNGKEGNDQYVWSLGDGNDSINETGGSDVIAFGAGIALNDLTFSRSANNLIVDVSDGSSIQVQNHFGGSLYAVEEIRLDDGSVHSLQVLANTAPVAMDDSFIGDQDANITGNLLVDNGGGVDSDPENNALSVVAGTYATTNGSVIVSANGDFTYTPNTSYNGADSFTYTLEDGFGGNDTATVNMTVRPPNVAPVAQDDVFTGDQDANITGSLLVDNGNGADSDPDSDPLNVVAGTYATTHGSVTISANGSFTYTPTSGYVGADSFTYTLQDDRGGSDTASVSLTLNAASQNAVNGTSGVDYLYGDQSGVSNDVLTGFAGNDYLYGQGGGDSYVWDVGDGNDTINEAGGIDQIVLHNVLESDIRIEKSGTYNLKINIGGEYITVSSQYMSDYYNSTGYDQYQVETLLLDDGTVIDVLDNLTFVGTSGNDYLYSMNAGATLEGAAGNDTLYGYAGNESYVWSVGDGNDTINETGGVDQIVLHNVLESDIRIEKSGTYNLKINIGGEYITVSSQYMSDYYNSTGYDQYQVETLLLDDGTVIDVLDNLTFVGTSGNDYLYSMNAGATLEGAAGNDTLYGYAGNESYVWSVGDGNDTINETGGVDQIVLHNVLESDITLEVSGTYNLKINIGGEYITVSNQFYSDYYNTSAYDTYQVETLLLDDGTVIDILNNLTFTGTSGNDYIYGLNASDTLIGEAGSDYLYGDDGDDVLYGGAGVDMLYGQAGADTFVFDDTAASDNIQDFDLSAGDKLDVSDLLVGYDPLTDAITDFVQITETGTNSYLNVDADGGADNFVQVAYIYNETGLTDEDALETSGNLITV